MTDADLARWEADAQYRAQDHADETIRERTRTEALLALIAEVRSLRCQLHLLHGMTNEHGRALFPGSQQFTESADPRN